jgi:hypothetical protein
MKPTLGWTMLSRDEMRQVERSLANSEQDTRDEIGFLLIHQGLADRFFPGTSVLHNRLRLGSLESIISPKSRRASSISFVALFCDPKRNWMSWRKS